MNARGTRSHPRNKRCPGRERHSPGQFPARFHTQDGLGTAGQLLLSRGSPFLPPGRVSFFRGFFPAPVPGALWKEAFFCSHTKKIPGTGSPGNSRPCGQPGRGARVPPHCAHTVTHTEGASTKLKTNLFGKIGNAFFCGLLIFPKKFFLSVPGSPAATFLKVLAKAFSPDYSFSRVAYRLP